MATKQTDTFLVTPFDRKLDVSSTVLLIILWLVAIATFLYSPFIIPIHYNYKGVIDGYGSKWTILLLPLISTLIFFGITVLIKRPHLLNYSIKITPENRDKQFAIACRMLRMLKLSTILVFLFITVITFLHIKKLASGLGWVLLPLVVFLVVVPVVVQLRQSFINK
ncbi:MAG: hypothetical protein RIR12_2135 [Bacteroidota bacterium]|jgi:hypothetical protein